MTEKKERGENIYSSCEILDAIYDVDDGEAYFLILAECMLGKRFIWSESEGAYIAEYLK